MKILPAFDFAKEAAKAVMDINASLTGPKLDSDPQVHLLALWREFTNTGGAFKSAPFSDGLLHLGPAGCEVLAIERKPLVKRVIAEK